MKVTNNNNETKNYNKLGLKNVFGEKLNFSSLFLFYSMLLHMLYSKFSVGAIDYISFLIKNTDMDGDDIADLLQNLDLYEGTVMVYEGISSHFVYLDWDDSVFTCLKLEHLVEALCCWRAKKYDFDANVFHEAFRAFNDTKDKK